MFQFKNPNLDARLHGTGSVYTATAGQETDFYYTIPFDCRLNGIEILTDSNVQLGDTLEMRTEYDAGQYGWKLYKKCGKDWNVMPSDRSRILMFPTASKAGVRVRIRYKSTGAEDVKFVLNLFTFVDSEKINPAALEEGTDW